MNRKPRFMPCADEDMRPRWFQPIGADDYICECGFMQRSSAEGAAHLCELAEWHSVEAYNDYARIARSAGFKVPSAKVIR